MIHARTPVALLALKGIPSARAQPGAYWEPLPHDVLLSCLLEGADVRKVLLVPAGLALSPNGAVLAAGFVWKNTPQRLEVPEGEHCLGLLSSNNGSRALRGYLGLITPGGTGVPLAEVVRHRHTRNLDLNQQLAQLLDALRSGKVVRAALHHLQHKELSPAQAALLLSSAAKQKLMPWPRIGKVHATLQQCCGPSLPPTVTGWELLVRFAEVARANPPLKQLEQIHAFTQLLLEHS